MSKQINVSTMILLGECVTLCMRMYVCVFVNVHVCLCVHPFFLIPFLFLKI